MGLKRGRAQAGLDERGNNAGGSNTRVSRSTTDGQTRRQAFDCKYHGKNWTHSSVDCDRRKRSATNEFYGNRNQPRSAASVTGQSGSAGSRWAPRHNNTCNHCKQEWFKGHKCQAYFESEVYKQRLQNKQVNAIRACDNTSSRPTRRDDNEPTDEDDDMNEYLGEVEA